MTLPAPNVLVIEDEAVWAMEAQEILTDHGFVVPGFATDADAAMCLARDHCFDLALVDVTLNETADGLTLARKLANELGVPALYMTGQGEDIARRAEASSQWGVIPWSVIRKPVAEEVLVARVTYAVWDIRYAHMSRLIEKSQRRDLQTHESESLTALREFVQAGWDDMKKRRTALVERESHGGLTTHEQIELSMLQRAADKVLRIVESETMAKLDEALERVTHRDQEPRSLRVFVSYSHEDEKHRDRLAVRLKGLERRGVISVWHDRQILPGEHWSDVVSFELERADVVLLLISDDFLASDYCHEVEMSVALKRHLSGACRVVSVILRPTASWQKTGIGSSTDTGSPILKLGDLQAVPTDGKPVTEWKNRDRAWVNITEEIERVIESVLNGRHESA